MPDHVLLEDRECTDEVSILTLIGGLDDTTPRDKFLVGNFLFIFWSGWGI